MRRMALLAFLAVLLLGLAGCWPDPGGSGPGTTPTAQTLITVPDVTGHNADVAVDELRKAGFTDIDLGTVDGRPMVVLPQNWTVKTQSAKPGDRLAPDAKIVLGCTRNG